MPSLLSYLLTLGWDHYGNREPAADRISPESKLLVQNIQYLNISHTHSGTLSHRQSKHSSATKRHFKWPRRNDIITISWDHAGTTGRRLLQTVLVTAESAAVQRWNVRENREFRFTKSALLLIPTVGHLSSLLGYILLHRKCMNIN